MNNLTASEIHLLNAYCGISCITFLILAATFGLQVYLYCRKSSFTGYIETLLLILTFFLMLYSFIETLQWLRLFTGTSKGFNDGCMAIAFIHQYCLISLLTNITCIAVHLLLQIRPPRCLAVIGEEKKRRYNCLMWLYLLLDTMIPLLISVWPFIKMAYGQDNIICWIARSKDTNHILKITLWLIWPLGVAAFVVTISSLTLATLHFHTSEKCNATIVTFLILMSGFILAVVLNAISFFVRANRIIYDVFSTLCVSILLLLASFVLLIRILYIIHVKSRRMVTHTHVRLKENLYLLH